MVGVSGPAEIRFSANPLTPTEVDLNANTRAFLWEGVIKPIPLSAAYGINDSMQVVGQANGHAALWTAANGVTDLGNLPGFDTSAAIAINNLGQVLCNAHSATGEVRSFLWTAEGGIQDLGFFGNKAGVGRVLGSDGTVAGATLPVTAGAAHWFTWTQGSGFHPSAIGTTILANTPPPAGITAPELLLSSDGYLLTGGMWIRLDYLIPSGLILGGTPLTVDKTCGMNENGQIIATHNNQAFLLTPM